MKLSKFLIIILACVSSSVSGFSERTLSVPSENNFTVYELQKFQEHSSNRLPNYIEHFKKYSEAQDIPWTLLAAVAYQESKWNHKARSYTGVRGIMQITEQTAEHIGIENRRDPVESIKGGAYYLRYLFNKTSPQLSSMQRWHMTLIAYNIGWAHLKDAHRLAVKLKKDPTNWKDLKEILPKLEDENYYPDLRYGYARGTETVQFVENVFSYYNLLAQNKLVSKN